MPPLSVPSATLVLGAMITPSVLISAAALLVLSTSNRLGRVVDRVRHLLLDAGGIDQQLAQAPSASLEARRELVLTQLELTSRRVLHLRGALMGLYVTILMLVVTSIAVGVDALRFMPAIIFWLPVGTGLAGAVVFLISIVELVIEAHLAVTGTLAEVAYVRQFLSEHPRRPEATDE